MTLEEYINKNYPDIAEEYKRFSTPNYFEYGVLYYPQRAGFGCSGKSNKKLRLIDSYIFENETHFVLEDENEPKQKYISISTKAHKDLKRVDENVDYNDNIVNNRVIKYVEIGKRKFLVRQHVWRDHYTKRISFRVMIIEEGVVGHYEYYNMIGKEKPNLKHVYGYDSANREQYHIMFHLNVRKMKSIIFGNPNIKVNNYFVHNNNRKP